MENKFYKIAMKFKLLIYLDQENCYLIKVQQF